MRLITTIVILCFLCKSIQSQSPDLSFYCDAMANAFDANHRIFAAEQFDKMLGEELAKEGSFAHDFSECKWLSIKQPVDGSFRILTWQIKGENDRYSYKGYVQTAEGKLTAVEDHSSEMGSIDFDELSADDWFGALYYKMVESGKGKDKYYLLFGYNGWDDKIHKKIIDVLSFRNGIPVFGKPVFDINSKEEGKRTKSRILIDYDATANVNCNYNEELEMIVHDYVTARTGFSLDGQIRKIPDGTYVAYKYNGKTWDEIEKLPTKETKAEDIFFQPKDKESEKGKDIFGRDKKGG